MLFVVRKKITREGGQTQMSGLHRIIVATTIM